MTVNFLTNELTQEERENFLRECAYYVKYDRVVINIEKTSKTLFCVSMFNIGCDTKINEFLMSKEDFARMPYAYSKLLDSNSQLCKLHKIITKLIKE